MRWNCRQSSGAAVLALSLFVACNTAKFGGNNEKRQVNPPPVQAAPTQLKPTVVSTPRDCSKDYEVPATANPYLAGAAPGAALNYTLNSSDPQSPTDRVPGEAPILVTPTDPNCMKPGVILAFTVSGSITHNQAQNQSNADGNLDLIVNHQLGATNGISDIKAPIDSLVGVFLGNSDPRSTVAPSQLDFSSAAARDYQRLEPKVGQVFFIGKGKTGTGSMRQVVVPVGATRLYFGTMDTYQWNNNAGGLRGAIIVLP